MRTDIASGGTFPDCEPAEHPRLPPEAPRAAGRRSPWLEQASHSKPERCLMPLIHELFSAPVLALGTGFAGALKIVS